MQANRNLCCSGEINSKASKHSTVPATEPILSRKITKSKDRMPLVWKLFTCFQLVIIMSLNADTISTVFEDIPIF
jgi:hypothetical protein